jgi:hypothetical protein
MAIEIKSTNPAVKAIITGTAPNAARMMAARGLLPLAQADLLEILVALRTHDDQTVAGEAENTLRSQDPESLLGIASDVETAPSVLNYLATNPDLDRTIHEAVALNHSTPDEAISSLASLSNDGNILETIVLNQQRLIRFPSIIESILANPSRTPEAERRVKEVKREFFEKERGAQQIAEELRAQGKSAAAEFLEASESFNSADGELLLDDAWLIAEHIEVNDEDIDDSWLPLERIEEFYAETPEQRAAAVEKIIGETLAESESAAPERISLIRRIMLMTVKDRIKMGMKGDREARSILIRDSNKVVATAVLANARITDQEVEKIASMRTVPEEVLRAISMNRAWMRSYPIVLNLVRNPRCPIPTAMGLLPRLFPKDLESVAQNRNVSEAVRRQAFRLFKTRSSGNEKGGH